MIQKWNHNDTRMFHQAFGCDSILSKVLLSPKKLFYEAGLRRHRGDMPMLEIKLQSRNADRLCNTIIMMKLREIQLKLIFVNSIKLTLKHKVLSIDWHFEVHSIRAVIPLNLELKHSLLAGNVNFYSRMENTKKYCTSTLSFPVLQC